MTTATQIGKDAQFTADALQAGLTICHGLYRIDGFLKSGGWGKVYLATNSLNQSIVVKECFPEAFCHREGSQVVPESRASEKVFKASIHNFVTEARHLATLEHPAIVKVHQVFEDNNTGYIAMEFVEGDELHSQIDNGFRFDRDSFVLFFEKMLGCLGYLHSQNIIHRDIAPDNIIMRSLEDPVLIDFGTAQTVGGNTEGARILAAKDGYSPIEIYLRGAEHGPATDIYALAATFYFVATGKVPPSAQTRMSAQEAGQSDPYVPLSTMGNIGYPDKILESIDKAMSLAVEDRYGSIKAWLSDAMMDKGNVISFNQPKPRTAEAKPQQAVASAPSAAPSVAKPAAETANSSGGSKKIVLAAAACGLLAVPAVFLVLGKGGAEKELTTTAAVAPEVEAPVGVATPVETKTAAVSPEIEALVEVANPNIGEAAPSATEAATGSSDAEIDTLVRHAPSLVETADKDEAKEVAEIVPPVVPSAQADQVVSEGWVPIRPFFVNMAFSETGETVLRVDDIHPSVETNGLLTPGSIILRIDGADLRNTTDYKNALNAAKQEGVTRVHLAVLGEGNALRSGIVEFADQYQITLKTGVELLVTNQSGNWVAEVVRAPEGAAVRAGDLLTEIDGHEIQAPTEINQRIAAAVADKDRSLKVVGTRDGKKLKAKLDLSIF